MFRINATFSSDPDLDPNKKKVVPGLDPGPFLDNKNYFVLLFIKNGYIMQSLLIHCFVAHLLANEILKFQHFSYF